MAHRHGKQGQQRQLQQQSRERCQDHEALAEGGDNGPWQTVRQFEVR